MTNNILCNAKLILCGKRLALASLFFFVLFITVAYTSPVSQVNGSREQLLKERDQILVKVKMEQATTIEIERLAQIEKILAQPRLLDKSDPQPGNASSQDQTEIHDLNK